MAFVYTEFQHDILMEIILEIFKSNRATEIHHDEITEVINALIQAIDSQEFDITTRQGELIIPNDQGGDSFINDAFPLRYIPWLRYFSSRMCREFFPRNGNNGIWYSEEEYSEIYSWVKIKKILQFYRNDFSEYLDAIRSEHMSLPELNQRLNLGLGENPTHQTITERSLVETLFTKRYITLATVFWFNEEEQTFEESHIENIGDSIISGPYWSVLVQDKVLSPPAIQSSEEKEDEIKVLKEKVKGSLKVIQSTMDEQASKFSNEGVYLELMNQLKIAFDYCA